MSNWVEIDMLVDGVCGW